MTNNFLFIDDDDDEGAKQPRRRRSTKDIFCSKSRATIDDDDKQLCFIRASLADKFMTATNDLISHNDGERQATTTTWEEFGSTKTASDKRQRRRRRFLFKRITPTYQRQVALFEGFERLRYRRRADLLSRAEILDVDRFCP